MRRLRLSPILLGASVAVAAFLIATNANAGETVDLRDGASSFLYGGRFTGNPPVGDFYGWSVATGDIDGDGYMDFLASSQNAEGPNDTNPEHQSDVYLLFGRSRGDVDSVYAVDDPGVADIVFYRGGWTIGCADIDADGYDDVILSEILAQSGVYVVFGGPRDQLRHVYNFDPAANGYTAPDIHIVGASKLGGDWIDTRFVSLALTASDLNGDGYGDIIVGDLNFRGPAGGRVRAGAVYVIFGRPRNAIPPVISVVASSPLPHPDVAIYGEVGDAYPVNMTTGDLDGDGIGDLVTCTYRGWGEDNIGPETGEVHCFFGRHTWGPRYDTQIEAFDFALSGRIKDAFGYRLTTGDLDGDGRDDLIVGSPFGAADDINRSKMGEYRVFFGRARGLWPQWGDAINLTDVLIIGADTGEAYSLTGPQEWAVAFSLDTGDRNRDSYSDLLIGAGYGRRPNDDRPGKAYLLMGRARGFWPPFIDLTDGFDTVIYGVDYLGSPGYQFDLLGSTVTMADWDNDGADELFLAAQFGDGPSNTSQDCGEVYVVFSEDSLATPVNPVPSLAQAALLPNYPNPFHQATTLRYDAPMGVPVSITVYDVRGRRVARPLEVRANESPHSLVRWDGRGDDGKSLPSGVYFVKLRAGNEVHARKVLVVR